MMNTRDNTRKLRVGGLYIGGGAPVTVQSLCTAITRDVEACVEQIKAF